MPYVALGYVLPGYTWEGGILSDFQRLAAGQLVELFEIDATALGGSVVRLHAGTNPLSGSVVWQGATYSPFPIEASGFEFSGKGQLPRPVLRVANVTGYLGTLVRTYDDLIGARVTRRRTMVKYLDAVNFSGGVNPTADPTAELPPDIYVVDRKASENKVVVEFELAASFDVAGVQLPRRTLVQNVCPWRYRGTECGYAGASYWDQNDAAVGTLAQDVCGKRLSSCKLRFGTYAALPFGGFPSAGLVRS